MHRHCLRDISPALSLVELGLKNQRLIARCLDYGLVDHARLLKQADDTLARMLKLDERLSEEEQRAQGFTHYIWRTQGDGKVRPSHAANDGQVFAWDDPPSTGHPGAEYGCRCWAQPLDAIDPIYPLEALLGGLSSGAARAVLREIIRRIGRPGQGDDEIETPSENSKIPSQETEGKKPPLGGRSDTEWEFGKHKSEIQWRNRMQNRGWTKEQITDTIKNGDEYPAPNNVRKHDPAATATRYEKNGKFVVRDNQTKKILQIGGERFIPKDLP